MQKRKYLHLTRLDNSSKGKVFYGLHFYPGLAEYVEPDKQPLRVFINEDTIRKMSPTFAGCPVLVQHVDDVKDSREELRQEADGWVLECFYNKSDGKTWVKFIAVTDEAINAVEHGFKLSNAYFPTTFGPRGVWNGMEYDKQIVDGEYEHLAIVDDPRYAESIILTPEEFKNYNIEKETELMKIANSNTIKEKPMFEMFKRQKVENGADLENTLVKLPKSKKEITISNALTELDKILNMNGYANGDHMVKLNDKEEMSVNDLVKKHMEACNELSEMKAKKTENAEDDDEKKENEDDDGGMDNAALDIDQMGTRETTGDKSFSNEEGDDEKKENEEDDDKEKKKNEDDEKKDDKEKKKNAADKKAAEAKEKARRLKNANNIDHSTVEVAPVFTSMDQVERGKQLYGSN